MSSTTTDPIKERTDIAHNDLFRHRTPVQLRFNDFDILGHVNNTVHYELMDLAKSKYYIDLTGENFVVGQVPLMIVHASTDFVHQALMGEPLTMLTRVTRIGNKSITMEQRLINSDTGEVKSHCVSVQAYINILTGRSDVVPQQWRDIINAYEGKDLNAK